MTGPEQLGSTEGERLADHETIARLAADLVPALVERLGAAGLGELELREAGWRLRLRLPADAAAKARSAAVARAAHEADPDHVQLTLPEPTEAAPVPVAEVAPAPEPAAPAAPEATVVRSSAVGFFRVGKGIAEGARVKSGGILGTVDVLGISVEVPAPVAGVLLTLHVADREPVEYGQEICAIGEPAPAPTPSPAPAPAPAEAPVTPAAPETPAAQGVA